MSIEWLDNIYFPTNRSRLMLSRDSCCNKLDELGVSYVRPEAGFFVWADLSEVCTLMRIIMNILVIILLYYLFLSIFSYQ